MELEDQIFDCQDKIRELKSDILILVGRLYGEDDNTFAPETYEVMKRWRPVFAKLYLNAPDAKSRCKICGQGPEVNHEGCMAIAMHR